MCAGSVGSTVWLNSNVSLLIFHLDALSRDESVGMKLPKIIVLESVSITQIVAAVHTLILGSYIIMIALYYC